MARMTLDKGFSVDRKRALVQMSADGKPLAHMIFDGAALEAQIRDLARFRSEVREPVPNAPQPDTPMDVERAPEWRVPKKNAVSDDDVLLALRNAGFGWMAFLLEPDNARMLADALTERADQSHDPEATGG
jgi:hypothetical protein